MNCRCGDITCVQDKIKNLGEALTKLASYDGALGTMRGKISAVNSKFLLAIPANFATPVSDNLSKIATEFSYISTGARPRIESELISLNQELRSLEREDEAYHEEEERRKKAEQEKNPCFE